MADITKEQLEELYVEQRLSTIKCAKFLGVKSTSTILRYLNKFGIESRSKGRFDHRINGIDKEVLYDLYINKGLSVRECAQKLNLPSHGAIIVRLREFGINTRPQLQIDKLISGNKARPINKTVIQCDVCGKKLKRFPSQIHDKNFCCDDCYGKWRSENFQGEANPNYGNLALVGPANPNWKGGITLEEYCDVWKDRDFKREIRERDSFKCQNPDCRKNSDTLTVHHIDYDKGNCNPRNLITLCVSCNARANFNREFWEVGYKEIIRSKYEAEQQLMTA